MTAKKPMKTKGKTRTSMLLSQEVLKASMRRAQKLGISRGSYFEQLLRRDLGLPVGVPLDEEPSVFG